MATDDLPPVPSSFVNHVDLVSTADSEITAVSVYSDRAEVTRVFKISVKTGQNNVNINGLPSVLDEESVRCVPGFHLGLRRELTRCTRQQSRGSRAGYDTRCYCWGNARTPENWCSPHSEKPDRA